LKKITLVLATMLLSISSATATQITADKNSKILRITNRYNQARPIQFVERGIEFLVFPNGEFDFNTEGMRGRHVGNYYGRKTRRGAYNKTYGAPKARNTFAKSMGVYVSHDRLGRVRRVGSVFINYDGYGRIKRIGSVYMRYQRGKLKQVGGLHIQYNRRGHMVAIDGTVNHSNRGCGFCGVTGCSANHFDSDYAHNDWRDYDDNYYNKKENKKYKQRKKRKYTY